ncbi:MAG: efflux RND transporter periplasmic adaptor subunit [Burkholderiales bacterium]|jgi:RND family efflux transporter MFP subunit|nr:efflux RND transporter periplasmic adaptor subunit [Burkholderiales bacterium]
MEKTMVGACAAVLLMVLSACGKGDSPSGNASAAASASASGGGGPAVSVSSVRAEKRDYEVRLEATGTVTALNSVDVKPQVSSTITKVHFKEGDFVKAGQVLFTLDARPDETNVAKAQAQLQKDLASLADAQRQLARSKELFAQNFVSQVAVDTNQTLVDAQQAVVESDRVAIKAAQVGLSYNRIVAPSSGRAGTVNVFPGTLVQPTTATALVTITQLDPIAVSFNLPQRNLQDALQSLRSGGGNVAAVLPEGRGTLAGKLSFVDNSVDATSGTVKVKAQFDNKDEKLWPGAFVGVKLTVQTIKDAIVVPQATIVQGALGKVVFVVESGNKAAARTVEVLYSSGTDAVVTGVRPGDRVVLDGRQNLRNGSNVVERPADDASGPAGARGRHGGASAPGGGGSGPAASGAGRGKPGSGPIARADADASRAAIADSSGGTS